MTRTGPAVTRSAAADLEPEIRRFTRAEYHRMAEAGVLTHEDRVELLRGTVVMMTPMGSRHAGVVRMLQRALSGGVGDAAICSTQGPLVIGEHSEPEPDLMLLKPREDCYQSRHPRPEDVLLLIEVADTSLRLDRGAKLRLYAQAGVPEYWIVDLNRGVLITHRGPKGEDYTDVSEIETDSPVTPVAFPDCEIRLSNVIK